MALDEALMRRARATGEWTLRVYAWSVPTLSLGRNQLARGGYDLDALRDGGVDIVRRPTGGRAILHHHEVTYSVTGPVDAAGDLGESYGRINRLLLAGLRKLGAPVTIASRLEPAVHGHRETGQPGLLPCFHHPSPGEITLEGRKLAGSAQWRREGAFLQHGSILVDDDQMHIASFLTHPGPRIPEPATLRQALGRSPDITEVADALFSAVRSVEDRYAPLLDLDDALASSADALRERYLDRCWTWRR